MFELLLLTVLVAGMFTDSKPRPGKKRQVPRFKSRLRRDAPRRPREKDHATPAPGISLRTFRRHDWPSGVFHARNLETGR